MNNVTAQKWSCQLLHSATQVTKPKVICFCPLFTFCMSATMSKLPAHWRITIYRQVVFIQCWVDIATWHCIASYSCSSRLCYLKHLWVLLLYTAWLPYQNVMEEAHKNEDSHLRHASPYSLTSNFATAEVMKFFLYFASIFQIPYLQ